MFVENQSVTPVEMGVGVTRKVLSYSKDLMAVEVSFQKDAMAPMHSHPHSQASYVIKGAVSFTLGEETKTLEKGDSVFIGPDVVHGLTALEDAMILDVFTPMREDFL